MNNPPLFYTKHEVDATDERAVIHALRSGWLTQGPAVTKFEQSFKDYIDAPHAVAVNNGTAALHLAVAALGLKPGQKVLVTSMSFVASANCILYQGGEVEFVDISSESFNLCIENLSSILEKSPPDTYAGVVCVDFAGYPAPTEIIRNIVKKYGLWILEDASHAPGAYFINSDGKRVMVGSCEYADMTTFSFHPAKHIACGEGGMITVKDPNLHKKLLTLRTHGIKKNEINDRRPWLQDMQVLGFNYRLSDVNAALGLNQLSKIEASIKRRNEIAHTYEIELKKVPQIKTPSTTLKGRHALHLYVIQAEKRDELFIYLRERNIHCQIHYVPIYRMSFYQKMGFTPSDYPNTESYFDSCLSIPMYPSLSNEEVERVVAQITSFYL